LKITSSQNVKRWTLKADHRRFNRRESGHLAKKAGSIYGMSETENHNILTPLAFFQAMGRNRDRLPLTDFGNEFYIKPTLKYFSTLIFSSCNSQTDMIHSTRFLFKWRYRNSNLIFFGGRALGGHSGFWNASAAALDQGCAGFLNNRILSGLPGQERINSACSSFFYFPAWKRAESSRVPPRLGGSMGSCPPALFLQVSTQGPTGENGFTAVSDRVFLSCFAGLESYFRKDHTL